MALNKLKGNLERIMDKNLADLVRGIRNNKENEVNLAFWNFLLMTDFEQFFSGKIHSSVY